MRRSRFRGLALLSALILCLHALLLGELETRISARQQELLAPMPARMSVDFVRSMTLSAGAPRSPAPTARPQPAPVPRPVQAPASAPAQPASAAAPVVAAASQADGSDAAASAAAARQTAAASAVAPQADLPLAAGPSAQPAPQASAASNVAAEANVADAGGAAEPGPEWPLSTQLRYRLRGNYRGAVTGHAQVQWLRQGSHYQVHLDVAVGPSFAPLISRRMSSDGQLGAQGIQPKRYDEDTRVLLASPRRVSIEFGQGQVRLADGRFVYSHLPLQDSASQFVQLTWLLLTGRVQPQPGVRIDMPLALPRRVYDWSYEITGEETLETPMGALSAWHLRPLRDAQGGDLKSEVWLAPALQYLPVRLRIRQDEQTYIDLMLEEAPLQAAP